MVSISGFQCWGLSSIPVQGTEIYELCGVVKREKKRALNFLVVNYSFVIICAFISVVSSL